MTEAERLARNFVKERMKAQGIKVAYIREVASAAREHLATEEGKKTLEQARANVGHTHEPKRPLRKSPR